MNWIFLAISAYFLLSIESVANKFLISSKVGSWRLYLFYIGLLSAFSFVLAPFGLQWPGAGIFWLSVFAGVVFFGYLAFLFWSLKGATATRVFVLIGAVSTLVSFGMSHFLLGDRFDILDILGILFLLAGGFVISFKVRERKMFKGYGKAFFAGVLFGLYMVVLKYLNNGQQNFVSWYVYSRIGITGMTLVLFLLPSFRKKVFLLLKKKNKKQHVSNFGFVAATKALAGFATFLREYSIAIGSVAIVSALSSVQYFFVFIISIILAIHFSKIFKEDLDRKTLLFKMIGSVLVVAGVALVMS